MARYTRLCAGECGKVRGITAFRLVAPGQRAAVCRFCEDAARSREEFQRRAFHQTMNSRIRQARARIEKHQHQIKATEALIARLHQEKDARRRRPRRDDSAPLPLQQLQA